MSKDNGGSAFPVTNGMGDCTTGMTLRDYFATKAMQAIIPVVLANKEVDIDNIAPSAYEVADEMLKERVK